MQLLCYYIFATKCNKHKRRWLYIEKTHNRIYEIDAFSDSGECIFCREYKRLSNKICEKCLNESFDIKTAAAFISYQNNLINKFFKYNFKKELHQLYYEKYKKEFRISEKMAEEFLKEYCLEDEECFSRYILIRELRRKRGIKDVSGNEKLKYTV